MASNDVTLLADKIASARERNSTYLSAPESDAYFVAQNYLLHYNVAHDEIISGIVDGSRDGGIDAAYLFANSLCIRDDSDLTKLGSDVQLDLFLFQVKDTKGFSETAIEKLIVNLPNLLDFSRDESKLSRSFNHKVIETTARFLHAYRSLEMPTLRIYVVFASLKAEHLHDNTQEKAGELERSLLRCFGACQPSIDFLDAARLADLARERPSFRRKLVLAENPISTDTEGGYIAVVRLQEYLRFIKDQTGNLDAMLFDANVRDYEGDTPVNQSIRATLDSAETKIDFWWLNNGVTIVASRVQPANKLLELESPQIVNGLQTSHEIYKSGRESEASLQGRSLLVKVIQADDGATRDRIIRATNSQTTLGPSALRATDKVQRQIEERLFADGYFYERRKNYYKNDGRELDRLVSIEQMGQAVLSVFAQSPHVARGNHTKIYDEDIYDRLFSLDHPVGLYRSAILLHRNVEAKLRRDQSTRAQAENFVHHVTMLVAQELSRKNQPSAADIDMMGIAPGDSLVNEMLGIVRDEFAKAASRGRVVLFDAVAKDPGVTKNLLERMRVHLLTSKPGR